MHSKRSAVQRLNFLLLAGEQMADGATWSSCVARAGRPTWWVEACRGTRVPEKQMLRGVPSILSPTHHRSTSLSSSCAQPGDCLAPNHAKLATAGELLAKPPVYFLLRASFSCSSCTFDHNEGLKFCLDRLHPLR